MTHESLDVRNKRADSIVMAMMLAAFVAWAIYVAGLITAKAQERGPGSWRETKQWTIPIESTKDGWGNYSAVVNVLDMNGTCVYVAVAAGMHERSVSTWGISKDALPKGTGCQ